MGRAYGNIGVCAHYLGDFNTVITQLELAIAVLLRHRAPSDYGSPKFHQILAVLYRQKGDTQKASEYLLKASDAERS